MRASMRAMSPGGGDRYGVLGSRHRVLVIDDHIDTGETLAAILEVGGHDVKSATNGKSGIRIATEFRPDVVLLDIDLPDQDGYRVADTLRTGAATKDTLIIAISGIARVDELRRMGFDKHLSKPVDLDRLLKLIAAAPAR